MLGRESPQRSLFGAALPVERLLTPGSFYEVLYRDVDRLLRDDDFAACYDGALGRPSVPPARMAKLVLLQTYEDLSDRAALERMAFDLRWKAILGMELDEEAVGQATLVDFRARLQLYGKMRAVFDRFLTLALEAGLIQADTVQAIDSTAIWGRGAVEDTYNLLGAGLRKLLRVAAHHRGMKPGVLARELGLALTDPTDTRSLKGRAEIDWAVPAERRAFLLQVVEEARGLLRETAADAQADPQVAEAAALLRQLLVQDLEPVDEAPPAGPPTDSRPPNDSSAPADAVLVPGTPVDLRQGVAPDRVVSVGDPEMRVGHKSAHQMWDGYKAHVSVDTAAEIITGLTVSTATAYDGAQAAPMLRAQQALGLIPAALVGDQAYSKAEVRVAVAGVGVALIARVPPAPMKRGCFSKDAFTIDLAANRVTCPAGVVSEDYRVCRPRPRFVFPGATCAACALRAQCTPRDPAAMRHDGRGRTIELHPLEAVLQEARAAQQTPQVQALLAQRVVVERRLALLMRTGLRQARYIGLAKVEFQSVASAVTVNLRRLGAWFALAPPHRAAWAGAGA
jgi:transposase/IS5 family transposase